MLDPSNAAIGNAANFRVFMRSFFPVRPFCSLCDHLALSMGLEGIVSKRRDRANGAGGCRRWLKVKNPAHLAYSKVRDQLQRWYSPGKRSPVALALMPRRSQLRDA